MPIIFSDECRVCNLTDNRCKWIFINDFRDANSAQFSSKKISTMMWAAVGLGFKSKLIFPKGKINQEKYREYLNDSNVFDDADQIYGKFQYIFQHDGATCHTTPNSFKFIEKRARVLYGWPPNSPDLSPIEMLWAILKNRLCDVEPQPSNQEELEEALLTLWDDLEQDIIDDIVSTFENRLKMCADVFGGSISHFLSAGRKEVKDTDIFDRQNVPHLLNVEDNLLIYEKNLILKHKWTAISNTLKENFDIPPSSVKHKVIEFERELYDFKFHQEKYK